MWNIIVSKLFPLLNLRQLSKQLNAIKIYLTSFLPPFRESLMTAIEEKLMRRMKEQFQQNQAELETLKRTHEELKQGKAKLDMILSRLEKEKNDLDKTITVLKDKEHELDKAIERIGNQESIDVDDAVTTTAPLYKQ